MFSGYQLVLISLIVVLYVLARIPANDFDKLMRKLHLR